MPGAKAKAGVLPTVHLVLVSTTVVNYMLMVSNSMEENQYPVYPEQLGDEDRKLNPYAPV
jgi:hypothetical protein